MTLLLNSSSTTKRPIVRSGIIQLGETANERATGIAAAIHGPM